MKPPISVEELRKRRNTPAQQERVTTELAEPKKYAGRKLQYKFRKTDRQSIASEEGIWADEMDRELIDQIIHDAGDDSDPPY